MTTTQKNPSQMWPYVEHEDDSVQSHGYVLHRRLTHSELGTLTENHTKLEHAFDAAYTHLASKIDRDAESYLYGFFYQAIQMAAVLGFLDGQREGFRLAVAHVPFLGQIPLSDFRSNETLEHLIGQLATGLENPVYTGPDDLNEWQRSLINPPADGGEVS